MINLDIIANPNTRPDNQSERYVFDLRGGVADQRSQVSGGASPYSGSNPDCRSQTTDHGQGRSSVRPASPNPLASPKGMKQKWATVIKTALNALGGLLLLIAPFTVEWWWPVLFGAMK